MTAWQYWTSTIADRLSQQLGIKVEPKDIVVPPDTSHGDFAYGAFRLAKEQKKNPADLAKEIASGFDKKQTDIDSVTAAGPYVNFKLSIGDVVHRVVREIEVEGERYGSSHDGADKRIMLEYTALNTHKEVHVGHLRNITLGVSLLRVLRKTGWDVKPVSYYGDIGAHVSKCLWLLVKKAGFNIQKLTEKDVEQFIKQAPRDIKTGSYLGRVYAESTAAIEENPEAKEEVSHVLRQLEAKDAAWHKLWLETRKWSLEEMRRLFEELCVELERQYLESEVVDRGQQMVDELLKKGVAKESQGAVIVDLEDKKLGVFLIRKSDGTSIYATKDLALTELKQKEYPNLARSLYLVDNRQSFYFKQLFEVLHRMGFEQSLEYVGYEFLTLKGGAMSSRKGNVITYESFRNEVVNFARAEILRRHDDWSEGKVRHAAWAIAMAGVKFGILKQDSDKIYTFDMEQALSFDGATGPYCQYAATRLGSIVKKAGGRLDKGELTRAYDHATEKNLALCLAAFPLRIKEAAESLRPSVIALWCHEAAQAVNAFYRDVPVLESEGDVKAGRLRLAAAARQALVQGLSLLGIPTPDEM